MSEKIQIKYEECMTDDSALNSVFEVNSLAYASGYSYFIFNGYVFETKRSSMFNPDESFTDLEECELIGFPSDEELSGE